MRIQRESVIMGVLLTLTWALAVAGNVFERYALEIEGVGIVGWHVLGVSVICQFGFLMQVLFTVLLLVMRGNVRSRIAGWGGAFLLGYWLSFTMLQLLWSWKELTKMIA